MITIDQVKDSAVRYLESHALELGRFLVSATTAWIRDRKAAEAAIRRAHEAYERGFAEVEERMRRGSEPEGEAT